MKEIQKNEALIISDLHLNFDDLRHKTGNIDGVTLYLPVLEKIISVLEERMPEYLFNLGDTFHNKDMVSVTLLEVYRDFLVKVSGMGIKVVQIVGNHDFSHVVNDYVYHALRQFDLDNITIVHDVYNLNNKIGFMSYCRDQETYTKRIQKLGDIELLFGHFDINGFALGDDYIEKNTFLGIEDFAKFKLVISGHYHEPQEKDLDDFKLMYAGSAYTTTFGESDQEKRFIYLNLETYETEDIPTNMTFHKTLRITTEDSLPEIPIEDLKNGIKYKIKVEGTVEQYENFLLRKPKDYSDSVIIEPSFISENKERIEIKSSETKDSVIEKYVNYRLESLFPEEEQRKTQDYLDMKEALIKEGLKFMNMG